MSIALVLTLAVVSATAPECHRPAAATASGGHAAPAAACAPRHRAGDALFGLDLSLADAPPRAQPTDADTAQQKDKRKAVELALSLANDANASASALDDNDIHRRSYSDASNPVAGYMINAHGRLISNIVRPSPLGGAHEQGMASPVPEPGTWAMLLAGLSLVAWAGRRGRQLIA